MNIWFLALLVFLEYLIYECKIRPYEENDLNYRLNNLTNNKNSLNATVYQKVFLWKACHEDQNISRDQRYFSKLGICSAQGNS